MRRKARDCRTAAGAEERSRRRRQCCSAARATVGGWRQAGAVEKRRRRGCDATELAMEAEAACGQAHGRQARGSVVLNF